MYARTQKQIGKAMITQLDRVNGTADDRVQELRQQLSRLQDLLQAEQRKTATLQAQLDGIIPLSGTQSIAGGGVKKTYITPTEAAKRARVNPATVNRYLHAGTWRGYQTSTGRWLVEADQSFARPHKRKTRS